MVLSSVALATKAPAFHPEQQRPCAHRDSVLALLRPADPAYANAIALADTLRRGGIAVSCVLRSKLSGMFDGGEGAAFYRTDMGDIDAFLLPPSRDFSKLRISTTHSSRSWVYTFAGEPRMSGVPRWETSGPPIDFVVHHNVLFVPSNGRLAALLRRLD